MKAFVFSVSIFVILLSCGGPSQTENNNITAKTDTKMQQVADSSENADEDTKLLRKNYVARYHEVSLIDTTFTDTKNERIHILMKYYCLFDNALIIPGKYVLEDTTKTFVTHNYASDIKIIIGKDTVFNETITKNYFSDSLQPEWKNYSTIVAQNFEGYEGNKFKFGFSISIPVTDLGTGLSLYVDRTGKCKISMQ